jgi:hypothetical protein
MIQVDGLSRNQLEKALKKERMPFLSRLIRERHFSLENFYSGIPSTTPAVQAEIFYGRRCAVPAFHFLHRKTGEAVKMFEPEAAGEFDALLKETAGDSLISGGRSYSNIYQADAEISRYCVVDFATDEILRKLHPLKGLLLAVAYLPRFVRMLGLSILELTLAIVDVFKGLYKRHTFWKELQFVPTRIGVCIVLRELIRFRILLDIEKGIRLVHANFLGYDEQSHRRGPDSAFAHWTLRGIDRTLRDLYRAAQRSDLRDYELVLYSDHGQEHCESFEVRNERSLHDALAEVFSEGPLRGHEIWQRMSPIPERIGNTINRGEALLEFKSEKDEKPPSVPDLKTQIAVTAQGPMGHIYLPIPLSSESRHDYARALVTQAGIPLVLLPNRESGPRALVGFRFGFIGGWIVAAVGLPLHNVAAYFITRGTFREPVRDFLKRSGYATPSIPTKHRIWFTAVIAAVPGPPYFTKLYLLALTDLPFRVYLGIGAPIYVLFSFVPIGVGSAVTDFNMKWMYVITAGLVLTTIMGVWLKKHYSAERMWKGNPSESG